MEYNISPNDENYREKLIKVAESFRTFDVAPDEFIVQKGYSGNIGDNEEKIKLTAPSPLLFRLLGGQIYFITTFLYYGFLTAS